MILWYLAYLKFAINIPKNDLNKIWKKFKYEIKIIIMSSTSKSKELIVSNKSKEKLPVKYNDSSILDLVDNEIFLENRSEVKKYLPEILGRVLARTWIDENFKEIFKKDPLKTLSENGVFLPDEMYLEFQKPDTKRPKIVVYERKGKSNFKVRVVQLQLIMMAGR